MRLVPAIASSLLSLLALAGCADSPYRPSITPADTPTPAATTPATTAPPPGPTPSASATPTETAVALECPTWSDDPDAGLAAIGPISFAGACVGHSFDEAAANHSAPRVIDACPWYGELVSVDDPGLYVGAMTDPSMPGDSIMLFVLRWFADPADAASYEMPATAEGITIGSSTAAVLAAFPEATEVTFDDIARGSRTQLIATTGPDTTYNFDVVDGVVTEISWGTGLAEGGPNGDLCGL